MTELQSRLVIQDPPLSILDESIFCSRTTGAPLQISISQLPPPLTKDNTERDHNILIVEISEPNHVSSVIPDQSLTSLSYKELREKCRLSGLDSTGTKKVLLLRLQTAAQKGTDGF